MSGQRRKHGVGKGKLFSIFLAVAAVFAAIFLIFELVGRLVEPEAPQEEPEPARTEVEETLPLNTYDPAGFVREGAFIVYRGEETARRGVDVSAYQGEIDWAAVAGAGVEYAMIRVGYRGYTRGDTSLDALFYDNVAGALENGLDVGVYFFSQAINTAEAEAEAEIVLRAIEGLEITYPIVFDWEEIPREARTDNMDQVTLTACAKAFCETVEAAGYTAGVYFNQVYGYEKYILPELEDYVFWLAQYADSPDFYYDFQMWQYTDEGQIDGIGTVVDLNLSFWEP